MITDGIKILENEISQVIYWNILDNYDEGKSIESILVEIPFVSSYTDPVDQEHYALGYALAAWEIGALTSELLTSSLSIIDAAASVNDWTDSFSDAMGKMRKKELQKLKEKISQPNPKIRKPKKYKPVGKYLFQIHDLFTFYLPNKNYATAIVLNITEIRGVCTYYLGKIVYNRPTKPTIQDIKETSIVGDKGHSKNGMLTLSLFNTPEDSPFGLYMIEIDHKKLAKFNDQLTTIGSISLTEECKQASSTSTINTFQDLVLQFNTPEEYYKVSRKKTYPIHSLIQEN